MSTEQGRTPEPDGRDPEYRSATLRSSLLQVAGSAAEAHRDRRRDGLGLPAASLVAAARRRRRRFTVGVTATSAAAVAAVAFAGVALAGLPDDGSGIEPADWGVPYALCGTSVEPVGNADGLVLSVADAAPAITTDGRWTASAEVRDTRASDTERRGGHLSDVVLLVVQDGVVVGLQAEPVAMRGTPVDLGTDDVVRTPVDVGLVGCDSTSPGPLDPGQYEVVVQQTWAPAELSTDEDAWVEMVSEPQLLTVAAAGTADPATWTFPECGTVAPDEVPEGPLTLESTLPTTMSTTDPFLDVTTSTGALSGEAVFTEVDHVLAFVQGGRVVATARPDEVVPGTYMLGSGARSLNEWTAAPVPCTDPTTPLTAGEYTVWPGVRARLSENYDRNGTSISPPVGERWYLGEPTTITVED